MADSNNKPGGKPGWTYDYSDLLGQKIAYRKDKAGNLELYTEDKTHYTWLEIKNIAKHKSENLLQVHIIKKVFDGLIIS